MPEEAIQELKRETNIYFKKVASDLDLKKEMALLYEEKFTKDEIENLVTLYKSSPGQKSSQVLPEMTNSGGNMGKKYVEKYS